MVNILGLVMLTLLSKAENADDRCTPNKRRERKEIMIKDLD